jgi:ketosteroid isomerase-like protein
MRKLFHYLCMLCMISCNDYHDKKGVDLAMKQYDHLIKKMDADSIALLYTPDGDLGGIARGRDSIKKFLSTFKNIRVLSQASTTKSIEVHGDTSIQKGTYRQIVLMHEKDTVKVNSEYITTWLWMPQDGWHIKRMITKPVN